MSHAFLDATPGHPVMTVETASITRRGLAVHLVTSEASDAMLVLHFVMGILEQ